MAPPSKQPTPAGWEAGEEAEDQLFLSALDRFEASVFQGRGPVSAQSLRARVKQEVGTMSAGNSEDLPSWEQKKTMIQMLTHGFENVHGYEYTQCAPLKSTPRPAPSSAAVAAISASVRSAQWTRFRACAVGAALMPCEHVLQKLPYTAALCLRTVAAKSWRRARSRRRALASGAGARGVGRQVATRALMQMAAACGVRKITLQCVVAQQRSLCLFLPTTNALTPPPDCVLIDVEFRACCRHTHKQFRLASAASSSIRHLPHGEAWPSMLVAEVPHQKPLLHTTPAD